MFGERPTHHQVGAISSGANSTCTLPHRHFVHAHMGVINPIFVVSDPLGIEYN